jgi:N-glycosylase/DNA lyase
MSCMWKFTIFACKIRNQSSNQEQMKKNSRQFPEFYASHYHVMQNDIRLRLREFTEIPENDWFYEACYCILTPQSKAVHADMVVKKLIAQDFEHTDLDPLPLLRDSEHYIRFHNQKTANLQRLKIQFPMIREHIISHAGQPMKLRDILTTSIRGFGMKEAAHFMRNIGIFGPTILDRHILKHLLACGIRSAKKSPTNRSSYLTIERAWLRYCKEVDIPMEEMDLLFWALETGFILK